MLASMTYQWLLQTLQEVLPKAGLVVSEKGSFSDVMCKPKILPLKSVTLERIQEMEVSYARALPFVPFQLVF